MAAQTLPKRCPQCKQTFPRTTKFFHRDKSRKDGLQCYCKQCHQQRNSQTHQDHQEKYLQRNRRYYQANKSQLQDQQEQYRKTLKGYIRRLWLSIVDRCNNANYKQFKDYGGRGIKVKFACFEDFFNYVVKELQADPRGLTIDRIDNNGHYEPGNIRFVSRAENNQNKGRRLRLSP